jgi:hypothetical protein
MNYKNVKFGKIKLSCRLGDDLLLPVEPVFCQSASKFDPRLECALDGGPSKLHAE